MRFNLTRNLLRGYALDSNITMKILKNIVLIKNGSSMKYSSISFIVMLWLRRSFRTERSASRSFSSETSSQRSSCRACQILKKSDFILF